MKHKLRTLHFIGIGGSGMSGIAEVLLTLGYHISGSDLTKNNATQRLEQLGATIYHDHHRENLGKADVVIVSSAIPADNPERREARYRKIPIITRATMLAELMRTRQSIAIAGTHGKTTVTSLNAAVLAKAGLDPTYVIGGVLLGSGTHAKLGESSYIVVEADESDRSFLNLYPIIAVVTNIDNDHLENYQQDFIELKKAFIEFLTHLPFYGAAVVCHDDEVVRSMIPFISRPVITYGIEFPADYRAAHIESIGCQMHYQLQRKDKDDISVVLNLPGRHNVLNSLAAFAVAEELGVEDESILKALAQFHGINRRCENIGSLKTHDHGQAIIIEDYGHHPTEILVTVEAITAAYPQHRCWLVFQPHRYSRTRDCFDAFVQCLAIQPYLILTEVYSAGEPPISAADGASLMQGIVANGNANHCRFFVDNINNLPKTIMTQARNNDLFLIMGAGSIGSIMRTFIHENN